MKKVLALLLVLSMLFAFAACGKKQEEPKDEGIDLKILYEADDSMINTYTIMAVNPDAPWVDADGNKVDASTVKINTVGAEALINWILSDEGKGLAKDYGFADYGEYLFYLLEDGRLILGPFQGRPACIEIPPGRGVCGTAAALNETQVVPDVHAFPGHIACDSASRSEIVVPLRRDGAVWGVLDIDSPSPARFSTEDREGLEAFASILEKAMQDGRMER